jgi:hypothetical protein
VAGGTLARQQTEQPQRPSRAAAGTVQAWEDAVLAALKSRVHVLAEHAERSGAALPPPAQLAERLADLTLLPADGGEGQQELVQTVGPFWSSAKVRAELAIPTRQALDARIRAGSVLALKTSDGALVFPVLQFRSTTSGAEVRPALKAAIKQLRAHDPWTVALLLCTPADELDGLSPLAWTRAEYDPAALASYAQRVDAQWAR